ncbi:MAG TPA: hypothetical protein VM368_06250, partial [Flavisolibacter sp.]|nr:hypothetical protein [Flavisolibacter sp.]
IDADEALDETLQQHLKTTSFSSTSAYRIKRKNFLGKKYLKWGEWGNDYPIRLFNKKNVNWNDDPVHEQLALPPEIKIETLHGSLLHYTMKDTFEYSQKMIAYAMLNAQKYYKQQKKASWLKRYLAPPFSFFKHYFLQLGFLDGWEGILSARMTAFYTFLKYSLLHDLWQKEANI